MVFSHDGLRDSLTRVAAPPYFYESLKREISLSGRAESTITAIKFNLISTSPIYDYPLIAFSEIAARTFRLEDHIARLGQNQFVVLISGTQDVATQVCGRVFSQWTIEGIPGIALSSAQISHIKGESALEFLNRLDSQEARERNF